MATQTTIDRHQQALRDVREGAPPGHVARTATDILRDVVTLAELQLALLRTDSEAGVRRGFIAGSAFAVAIIVLVGVVPVALLAIAYLLADVFGLSLALALTLSSLLGVMLAIAAGLAGWAMARRAVDAFDRSRRELSRNLEWITQVLTRRQRATVRMD